MTMSSMEPSSSGGGVVDETNKDGIKSDDKLSATTLQDITLRSETILDCSTEKVAGKSVTFSTILTE